MNIHGIPLTSSSYRTNMMRVIEAAMADEDIIDKHDFSRFLSQYTGSMTPNTITGAVDSEVIYGPTLVSRGKVLSFAEDLKGATARPGMVGKLEADKLEVNPTEALKEYEVTNTDTIQPRVYRQMSYDSTITIATIVVQGVVSGLKYHISCDDPVIQSVIDQGYKRVHNDLVRNLVRTGFQDGYCFGEKIWKREIFEVTSINEDGEVETLHSGPGVSLESIKWIDPLANLKFFKSKKTGKLVYVEQQQGGGKIVKVPATSLVWFTLDKQYDNIFGRSRYKAAYPYWWNSKIGNQWSLKHLERTGEPMLVGRHPNGLTFVPTVNGTASQVQNSVVMTQILLGAKSGSKITLTSERDKESKEFLWDFEYKEPKSGDIKPFLDWDIHNERKKLEALGVFSSLIMPGSNFSDADAKLDLLVAILEDLVNQMEGTIQADVIDPLISYNFGEEYIKQVSYSIDRGGLGRRTILKEVLNNALRMSASVDGRSLTIWPDIEALLKELGIPTRPFKAQFFEDEQAKATGETPLQEKEADEKSNDVEGGTRQPDNRERDRSTERKSAMEGT
jgi:hypothetical protein